jgi:hypothetical protein
MVVVSFHGMTGSSSCLILATVTHVSEQVLPFSPVYTQRPGGGWGVEFHCRNRDDGCLKDFANSIFEPDTVGEGAGHNAL